MRSFIALPLPEEFASDLARFAARLKLSRPQPEENLHITLAFLDEQPNSALEDVHEELEATRFASVSAQFASLEPLGGKTPSVLGLRVDGVDALQKQVLSAVRKAGITLPHRRFRGHITLARLPSAPTQDDMKSLGHVLATHGSVRFDPLMLGTMSLYRSELHPDGARYERLADYPLSG
ncbi:RNA 2',3'-cyclic phosphodiesterase [Aliiroseovarius sp. 2305UL8-7]|uniref:RNA 2',3'-cyclic phosphodiesterase n=1 Tax=Aliiroseovarius conchicola TaxID=3121637 RepID=UPI003526C85B